MEYLASSETNYTKQKINCGSNYHLFQFEFNELFKLSFSKVINP